MRKRSFYRKNITGIFLCLLLVCLSGCAKKADEQQSLYNKESTELQMPEGSDFRRITLSGNEYFFAGFLEEKDGVVFYKADAKTGKSQRIISLEDVNFIDFQIYNTGSEKCLQVLSVASDALLITEYSEDGKRLDEFSQSYDNNLYGYPQFFLADSEKYYVVFNYSFLVLNKDGSATNSFSKDNASFVSGTLYGKDIVFSLKSEDGRTFISKFNTSSSKFDKQYEFESTIYSVKNVEETILLVSPAGLFEVDGKLLTTKKLLDFDANGISASDIEDFDYEEGLFSFAVVKKSGQKKASIIYLDTSSPIDKSVIKIFCPSNGASDLIALDMVKNFNEKSNEYYAQIIENDGPFDVTFLQERNPDVLYFFLQEDALSYIEKGFCEDLIPYINSSKEFSLKDINEKVPEVFGSKEQLFALPTSLVAKTLLIPSKYYSAQGGWTVAEYLSWLRENPDACALGGMTRSSILNDCLSGGISDFINEKEGLACFTDGSFSSIIEDIKNLPSMDHEESIYVTSALLNKYDFGNMKYIKRDIVQSVYELAQKEFLLNSDFVFAGYPNSKRERLSRIDCSSIFSIFSKSENKQGAFEFIEYALKYKYERISESRDGSTTGVSWTLNSLAELDLSSSIGEHELNVINSGKFDSSSNISFKTTENDVNLYLEIINSSAPLTSVESKIIDIIEEELVSFFEEQKSSTEVCNIIQNRAQIVLDEEKR